jgi:hypothetical protein
MKLNVTTRTCLVFSPHFFPWLPSLQKWPNIHLLTKTPVVQVSPKDEARRTEANRKRKGERKEEEKEEGREEKGGGREGRKERARRDEEGVKERDASTQEEKLCIKVLK